MAQSNLVHLMREEKTSRGLAELMKELVLASGAPDETRKTLREKIDIVCRNSKEKEHSRKIEEFAFTKARRSIEDWEAELKRSEVHPTKDNHFKSEYGVNYINTCKESWTRKEDEAGWTAVDTAKENWERDQDNKKRDHDRKQPVEGAERAEYERKVMTKDDLTRIFDETKREIRLGNRKAMRHSPIWEVAARTQNNDSTYEDKELRFKDREDKSKKEEHRETDWYQNIQNISELGGQLGYTERHFKNVLSRFISWFNPELSIVTDRLTADETARFLMRLHTPDTDEEKIDKQINRLTRKAGTSLRPVMAYLLEIVSAKYQASTPLEKETEIRKEMIRGLVKFTRGDLQIQIVQSIEYARRSKDKLDWKFILEKAIDSEMIQGTPQVDIKYQNHDANEAALQKLYNVSTGIDTKPRYQPNYAPGKDDERHREYYEAETRKETESDRIDLSEIYGDYPTSSELRKILGKEKQKMEKVVHEKRQREEAEQEEECRKIAKLEEREREKEREREISKNDDKVKLLKKVQEEATRKSTREKAQTKTFGIYAISPEAETVKTDRRDIQKGERSPRENSLNRDRSSPYRRDNTTPTRRDNSGQNRRDNSVPRRRDDRDNRSRDRNNTGWNNRNTGRNDRSRDNSTNRNERGRSRERQNAKETRTNYSTERTPTRRDRSDSTKDRQKYGITSEDFRKQKGEMFRKDFIMRESDKECDKCGDWRHFPWNCDRYRRYSKFECKTCSKGLHHWADDCMGGFRDRMEQPYKKFVNKDGSGDSRRNTDGRDRSRSFNSASRRPEERDRSQSFNRERGRENRDKRPDSGNSRDQRQNSRDGRDRSRDSRDGRIPDKDRGLNMKGWTNKQGN